VVSELWAWFRRKGHGLRAGSVVPFGDYVIANFLASVEEKDFQEIKKEKTRLKIMCQFEVEL